MVFLIIFLWPCGVRNNYIHKMMVDIFLSLNDKKRRRKKQLTSVSIPEETSQFCCIFNFPTFRGHLKIARVIFAIGLESVLESLTSFNAQPERRDERAEKAFYSAIPPPRSHC